MLIINGAYGEGGGQILRTSLALAAILQQPIRLENIRARRKNPGLAAQHLASVRAAALICEASVSGDALGSTSLTFEPQSDPIPGLYEFDVSEARQGGSAGAATLVLQTVLLPLTLAGGPSTVTVKGGTHVPWSPPFHYLRDVFLPTIRPLGFQATLELLAWGWYPAGQGEIRATIPGRDKTDESSKTLSAVAEARGALKHIHGVAVASSLPAHIAQRIRNRAANLLDEARLPHAIEPQRVRSVSPGAGIFLAVEYESGWAGFSALGELGKPSEQVAQEAVEALLAFHHSGARLDEHLADQLILPLALSGQSVTLSMEKISEHTRTNLWVVEQFLGPVAHIDPSQGAIQFTAKCNGQHHV
ncbi:MAG: RNA 3'-terminal phosphate cyclase [Anaerolineae bacterium]|nr:RNA 3'-phosphate cyclase [Anaerolineales bacterium]MCQ3980084.1 RNA 3'-phosphate cyclase [Anaerolineae bacterium]